MSTTSAHRVDPAVWRGRSVFLTGHTGFKGAWLSRWLTRMETRVTGYSLAPTTTPNLHTAAHLTDGITHRQADICDLPTLTHAMQHAAPDVVFHLAAQSLVRVSYAEPVETYAVNVMGTVNLLEAVRKTPSVKAVVIVTTDKCYDNREWHWAYREDDALGGHDPYSNSKACAELVTDAYRRSFFHTPGAPSVATARAGNVIGGGDFAQDRLLPDAARAFGAGRSVVIRNPAAVRPWQHVLDPLRGYLMLAQSLLVDGKSFSRAYNFGPSQDDVWPVSRVMDRACELWGSGARWEKDAASHPHEAHTLSLDSARAHRTLHWRPQMTTEQALATTVAFYRALHEGRDARALMDADLQTFERT